MSYYRVCIDGVWSYKKLIRVNCNNAVVEIPNGDKQPKTRLFRFEANNVFEKNQNGFFCRRSKDAILNQTGS